MPQYVVKRNKKDTHVVFGKAAKTVPPEAIGSIQARMSSSGHPSKIDIVQTDITEEEGADYLVLYNIPFGDFRTRTWNEAKTSLGAKVSYGTTTATIDALNTVIGLQASDLESGGAGVATTVTRDALQGYYGYETDFHSVGVANTIQLLDENAWNLLMPQVAAGKTYQYLPTDMGTANGGDPWVGSGATVGTGQTEFSLAGTTAGTNCIVRISYNFVPDVDDSELNLRLHFTTNTATQGAGLTNFDIEKQGLVCVAGAGITYKGEEVIPFFVGTSLEGDTKTDAGRFCVQINPSDEGEFETQALTVMVDM